MCSTPILENTVYKSKSMDLNVNIIQNHPYIQNSIQANIWVLWTGQIDIRFSIIFRVYFILTTFSWRNKNITCKGEGSLPLINQYIHDSVQQMNRWQNTIIRHFFLVFSTPSSILGCMRLGSSPHCLFVYFLPCIHDASFANRS